MKNIIKIVILMIGLQLNAQIITPVEQMVNFTTIGTAENHYFKDVNNELNKFLGNWKYQSGNDLIEISIYKEDRIGNGMKYHSDELYMKFKYLQGGNVIFDTFTNADKYLIAGGSFWYPTNTNKYHILYREPTQNKFVIQQWIDLEYIPTSGQPQLSWVTHYQPMGTGATPPQMPINMVFIKQP